MKQYNLSSKELEIKKAVDIALRYMDTRQYTPKRKAEVERIKNKYGLKRLKKYMHLSYITLGWMHPDVKDDII